MLRNLASTHLSAFTLPPLLSHREARLRGIDEGEKAKLQWPHKVKLLLINHQCVT